MTVVWVTLQITAYTPVFTSQSWPALLLLVTALPGENTRSPLRKLKMLNRCLFFFYLIRKQRWRRRENVLWTTKTWCSYSQPLHHWSGKMIQSHLIGVKNRYIFLHKVAADSYKNCKRERLCCRKDLYVCFSSIPVSVVVLCSTKPAQVSHWVKKKGS